MVLWFLVVMGTMSLLAYRYWARPAEALDRVSPQALEPLLPPEAGAETAPSAVTIIIRRLGTMMPSTPEKAGKLRRRLIAAGFRSDQAVGTMYGIQVAAAALAGVAGFSLLTAFSDFSAQVTILVSLVLALGGYVLPGEILWHLVQRRRRLLRHSLPDALDLLVVCVEAGSGLDQALVEVSEELKLSHPQLSEEFGLVNLELRAGTRRMDALRHLADRTGEEEIRKLVALLIQTDRFGTSIAQALRTHSDFMRVKRRQIAEEKANKVGVKLVFPIFFLILPAMFLVTVGPALLHLIFEFFPSLKSTIR
jgi:tight adherence protein C